MSPALLSRPVAGLVSLVGLSASLAIAEASAPDANTLDFRAALQQLVSVNETLQASRAAVDQSRAERAEADARRLPTVELRSRYSHLNAPRAADLYSTGNRYRCDWCIC